MRKKHTTQEHINKIIEFRQAIHANGFGKQRDAMIEALDALCITGSLSSFPLLSLSKVFRRQWHSLYKAVERGAVKDKWLSRCHTMGSNTTPWMAVPGHGQERARTMDDRQYVYHPTAAINDGSICISYPYSLLDWVHHVRGFVVYLRPRIDIPSSMTAGGMGIAQIKELAITGQH